MKYVLNGYFAQAYSEGSYNGNTYSASTTTSTGSGQSTNTASGGSLLTNTGFDVALSATFASVIIFSALVIRFWKRPAKKAEGQAS